MAATPQPGEVCLWRIDLAVSPEQLADCRAELSAEELARADGILAAPQARRFVVCRAQLRRLLGQQLNAPARQLTFAAGPQGKPSLAGEHRDSSLQFNVSHTGDTALIALAWGRQVGIDVEQVRKVSRQSKLLAKSFLPNERRAAASALKQEPEDTFFRLWTMKEAAVKCAGAGMFQSMAQVQIQLDRPLSAAPATAHAQAGDWAPACGKLWIGELPKFDGCRAALAVVGEPPASINARRWMLDADDFPSWLSTTAIW